MLCSEVPWDFTFIEAARRIGFEYSSNLVPHSPENAKLFLLVSPGVRWIIKSPMVSIDLTWKHWTNLISVPAYGNYRFDVLVDELVQVFRSMPGDIYPDFFHHLNSKRMNITGWYRPGTLNPERIAEGFSQNALREMAAAGVASAEYQDGRGRPAHGQLQFGRQPARFSVRRPPR